MSVSVVGWRENVQGSLPIEDQKEEEIPDPQVQFERDILFQKGNSALESGNYSEAILFLSRATDDFDQDSLVLSKLKEAHKKRGETYFAQGRYLFAITDFFFSGETERIETAKGRFLVCLQEQFYCIDWLNEAQSKQCGYILNQLELLRDALGRTQVFPEINRLEAEWLTEAGNEKFWQIKKRLDQGYDFANKEEAEGCLKELKEIQKQFKKARELDYWSSDRHAPWFDGYLTRVRQEVVNATYVEWEQTFEAISHRLFLYSPYEEATFKAVEQDCLLWLDLFNKLHLEFEQEKCEEARLVRSILLESRQAKARLSEIDTSLSMATLYRAKHEMLLANVDFSSKDLNRYSKEYESVLSDPSLRVNLARLSAVGYSLFKDQFQRYLESRIDRGWFSRCVLNRNNPLTVALVRSWLL